MNEIIAICNDIPQLQNNRCLDKTYCEQFPGSSWLPEYAKLMENIGISTITGDIALLKIKTKCINPKNIVIIQELNSQIGKQLIHLGAKSAILTSFESPLYAYYFYDILHKIAPLFKYRILFSGTFSKIDKDSSSNIQIRFPSFFENGTKIVTPWKEKKNIIIVVANKFGDMLIKFPIYKNPIHYLGLTRSLYRKWTSSTRRFAIKHELITKRLESIEYFGKLKQIDLYGYGWNNLNNLSNNWRKRLATLIEKMNPQICENKKQLISKYKFSICFENCAYPGYITEKIIDCFISGVIPIYLGAPDITKYIPKNTFIDMRNFNSWKELDKFLQSVNENDGLKMIYAAQEFLNTDDGKSYSYERWAKSMMEITLNYLKS